MFQPSQTDVRRFFCATYSRVRAGAPLETALRFAAALAALKLSLSGDIASVTRAEVERVRRPVPSVDAGRVVAVRDRDDPTDVLAGEPGDAGLVHEFGHQQRRLPVDGWDAFEQASEVFALVAET